MPLMTMMTTIAMSDAVAATNNGDAATAAGNDSNGRC
jgi:hypothetical protein